MRKLRILIMVAVVVVAAAAITMLVPGVASSVLDRLTGPSYRGHSMSHWVKETRSADPMARSEAAFALGAMGPEAGEAVPELCSLLKDPETRVRCNASLALLKMYPASRGTAPALAEVLEDDFPLARMNAAVTLIRLGPDSRPAAPALLKAVGEPRNDMVVPGFFLSIHEAMLQAVGRATAGSTAGVAVLREALKDDRWRCRVAAARALGDVGPEARDAVPDLRGRLLNEQRIEVREEVERALKKIAPDLQ